MTGDPFPTSFKAELFRGGGLDVQLFRRTLAIRRQVTDHGSEVRCHLWRLSDQRDIGVAQMPAARAQLSEGPGELGA